MTDGFWNFETRTENKWGSTVKKRKRQENTMIHWHSFPDHKFNSGRIAFYGNLIEQIYKKPK